MRYFIVLLLIFTNIVNATPIALVLRNAPTAEVISYLSNELEKNLIIVDEIPETKFMRIEVNDFNEMLHSFAKLHSLELKQDKNIYYVHHKIKQDLKEMAFEPELITKTIPLYYAKASELIHSLTEGQGGVISDGGYIHFDNRSNRLIIRDTPYTIKNITELVKLLDRPTEQIAIEARIVTISSENLQELGVRWGIFSPSESQHRFAGSLEGNGRAINNLNINFPVSQAASAVLQVATINSRVLDLELTALERENSVEIIASPRLLTTNKKQASIKQGTEIPYALLDKKSEISDIQFKEAVLGLEVTPHIAKDNQILLDLLVTQNAPNNQNGINQLTTIDKQELKTQVLAKHGETIVLGGVFQHLIAKGEDKVPILGSIPVIKYLFSQSRDKISKRELVIFVTPYIIKPDLPVSTEKNQQKARQQSLQAKQK